MEVGQIRLNKATQEWVIYAPSRRQRPHDFQQKSQEKQPLANQVEHCPFCAVNEEKLESIILEMPNKQQSSWQTSELQGLTTIQ